jgi:enoyl-CoA hydratase/carnithine racemase
VQSFEKPLLAAVNGVGVGLGFTLLAHCDLVFMADDARLRVPFAELGVPPEAASSYLFPRTMGWQRAAHLLFTGAWMGATEAVDTGLALAHYPSESLLAETLAVAGVIAAAPLDAVMASKRLLLATRRTEVTAARDREDAAFGELLGSAANLAALERFGTDAGS